MIMGNAEIMVLTGGCWQLAAGEDQARQAVHRLLGPGRQVEVVKDLLDTAVFKVEITSEEAKELDEHVLIVIRDTEYWIKVWMPEQ